MNPYASLTTDTQKVYRIFSGSGCLLQMTMNVCFKLVKYCTTIYKLIVRNGKAR